VKEAACFAAINRAAANAEHLASLVLPKDIMMCLENLFWEAWEEIRALMVKMAGNIEQERERDAARFFSCCCII
jgi:hypothetical protein